MEDNLRVVSVKVYPTGRKERNARLLHM